MEKLFAWQSSGAINNSGKLPIMCGLVGVASLVPVSDRKILEVQRDALQHRGPDDAGVWWSDTGRIGMAHRRLAIIDLTAAGRQPMLDSYGELAIVFNGEIYNYQELRASLQSSGHSFRTDSDTEVLLVAYREWGLDFLTRLNGMFVFALFDLSKQCLYLARDRAGEKPLFYQFSNGTLHFASELKALLVHPEFSHKIDLTALDCYLYMGFVPGQNCILQNVNKLPPAHVLSFDLNTGKKEISRYWHLPDYSSEVIAEPVLLDRLGSLLEDAVGRQLVADVPVGVLLSGGVDSSLVTAMAVRRKKKIKTFTVCFPGYGQYDESQYARLIAQHFETEHIELNASEISADLLPVLARQFDEPIVDSSMIPTFLVCQLVRQHCTVVLGGDGGDELFGGYHSHSRMAFLEKWCNFIPYQMRQLVGKAAYQLPLGFKGRHLLQSLSFDVSCGLPLISMLFNAQERQLMTNILDFPSVAEKIREDRIPTSRDALDRITRMDFVNYLAEDILVKVDRASMLASLEVRSPFLDYRLIEFAYGMVPSELKALPSCRKILLKKICDRILPPEFNNQRKQGFSIPLQHWLKKGPWYDLFHSILLDSNDGLFNKKFISTLLENQRKGFNNSERLFALALFELWRQEYKITY